MPPNAPDYIKAFTDAASISGWAKDTVETLNNQGMFRDLPGSAFNPRGAATRAEIASILHRYLTAIA